MAAEGSIEPQHVLNLNVAVIGHVDCGKTSLVKALSTVLSTAALDKHPQSRERGITLDLGFSAVLVPAPEHLRGGGHEYVQFTLVDCPGHASLIRTVIGGAAIIDMALLVVDVVKGLQAQTAECAAVAEAAVGSADDVLIALNKVDLLPAEGREEAIARAGRRLRRQLAGTKFATAEAVAIAAAVGGEKTAAGPSLVDAAAARAGGSGGRSGGGGAPSAKGRARGSSSAKVAAAATPATGSHSSAAVPFATATPSNGSSVASEGVDVLLAALARQSRRPQRRDDQVFYMAIDHCFAVRGQGTVLTGTVLMGHVAVNQSIELPLLRVVKKVKSIQVFRRAVASAQQGDRVGVCVAGLDPTLVERGVAAAPGTAAPAMAAVALVRRVAFFGGRVPSGSLLHVTLGHSTVMAKVTFFGAAEISAKLSARLSEPSAGTNLAEQAAKDRSVLLERTAEDVAGNAGAWVGAFELQTELAWRRQDCSEQSSAATANNSNGNSNVIQKDRKGREAAAAATAAAAPLQYALLRFQSPVLSLPHGLVIGSRLDADGQSAFGPPSGESGTLGLPAADGDVASGGGGGALAQSRIAFYGRLVERLDDADAGVKRVRLYTERCREAQVVRASTPLAAAASSGGYVAGDTASGSSGSSIAAASGDGSSNGGSSGAIVGGGGNGDHAEQQQQLYGEVIGRGLFRKLGVVQRFLGLLLETEMGELGRIEGAFGTGGKFKAVFPLGARVRPGDRLLLRYRKFAGDKSRVLDQSHLAGAYQKVLKDAAAPVAAAKIASLQQQQQRQQEPTGAAAAAALAVAGPPPIAAAATTARETLALAAFQQKQPPPPPPPQAANGSGVAARPPCAPAAPAAVAAGEHAAGRSPRVGKIEALKGEDMGGGRWSQAIVGGLFAVEEDIRAFAAAGAEVTTASGDRGQILGPFGKLGKCRVAFGSGTADPPGMAVTYYEPL